MVFVLAQGSWMHAPALWSVHAASGGWNVRLKMHVWPMTTRRLGLSHRLLPSLSAAGLVLALNTQTSALGSAGLWAQHSPRHLLIGADKALKPASSCLVAQPSVQWI